MTLPADPSGILVVLVLLIPGTAFAFTRTLLGGLSAADRNVQSRILQAVTASVFLDAAYLIVTPTLFAPLVTSGSDSLLNAPTSAGLGALLYSLVVPALVAVLVYYRPDWTWCKACGAGSPG